MVTLIIAMIIAVVISFFCSLAEAALFAVGPAYVRLLCESGSRIGRILKKFKENMDKPIAAILITNTIANVSMAGIAGAAASQLWGNTGVLIETTVFTLAILFFGEIIPKVLGVTYNRGASIVYTTPLRIAIFILAPLIWVVGLTSSIVSKGKTKIAQVPEEEILALAKISAEEGSILPIEKQIIMHALQLNNVTAEDIMTPRTVLLTADGNRSIEGVESEAVKWSHSRIPIYENEMHNIVGLVLRRDVFAAIAKEEDLSRPIKEIAKPLHFVPEMMTGDKLLAEFLKQKSHLFGVVDEYGEVIGVVSLEDVLETLIGTEIVDETDSVVDMQELAKNKWRQRLSQRSKHKTQFQANVRKQV